MVGGLLQLVAGGAQDIYLTGNPQMTFFKVVYRRHTNFSIESILQIFRNKIKKENSRTSCTISRKGDLIHKMYIQQNIPINSTLDNIINYGYNFIKDINVQIGSQIIDEHTNNWLETWAELTQPNEYGNFTSAENALFMNNGSDVMGTLKSGIINASLTATRFQSLTMAAGVAGFTDVPEPAPPGNYCTYLSENRYHYIYTPLQFWFCKNIGLSLPLIALQYHEVIINIDFSKLIEDNCSPELYVDYIFLDTDERKRFAQISHEYLIEQVQKIRNSSDGSIQLQFNNPVKEIIWVSGPGTDATYEKALKGKWKIQINGYDRFTVRDISYFTKQQIYDYHSGYGGVTVRNSIAVYSFCLNPEDHQPSGTINFSSIQNCYLIREDRDHEDRTAKQPITVYAINYNILRILSGQGNLVYSN